MLLVAITTASAAAQTEQTKPTKPTGNDPAPATDTAIDAGEKPLIIPAERSNDEVRRMKIEIAASRRLVDALEEENLALRQRLETEKERAALLAELSETRRRENDALRMSLAAKGDALAAKDFVIAAQEKYISELKAKKPSVWKRLGDIAVGVVLGAVLR